jgi:O-antigen/teichoic acid export membrane protein
VVGLIFVGDFSLYFRLVNVLLRGSTLLSKFLLIFFLAYYLEPSEVGLYGLFFAAVSYSIFLVGLDFYVFSTRELIASEKNAWGGLLKSHVSLVAVLYVIFFPFLSFLFYFELLPWRLAPWFFLLLFLEHFSQEFNRLFVAASKQILASIVLFVRSGAWCLVVIFAMYLYEDARNLEFVFVSWSIGSGFACILSLYAVYRFRLGGWDSLVNWQWIKRGLIVAGPFLLATLSIRGIFTIDRFFMEYFANLDLVGVYVLFIGMANALVAFLDAAVFVFIYPGLIRSFHDGDVAAFRRGMRKLVFQSLVVSVIFVACAVLLIDPILGMIGKSTYSESKNIFYMVLFGVFVFVAGFVPQYGLYAQGLDRHIVLSHMFSFVFFVFAVFLIAGYVQGLAVPIGLCVAFLVAFAWKFFAYVKLTPRDYVLLREYE